MMQILEAGGLPVLTDKIRQADDDNPCGYYEYEAVKQLYNGNDTWLSEAIGKVIKVVAPLLPYLPSTYKYKIIFMHRNLSEVLTSQSKMLHNREEDAGTVGDEELARIFERYLKSVNAWIQNQSDVERLDVSYNELIADPSSNIRRINHFLGKDLSEESMMNAVRPELYRQRKH